MDLLPRLTYRIARLLPGGIRSRLFLLVGLLMLPLVLLLGWIYYQRYETRRTLTLQTELEIAQGVSTTFAAFVDGVRREELALGLALLSHCDGREEASTLLKKALKNYPSLRNLSWTDSDGTVLASSLPSAIGVSLRQRPYFERITRGADWAIGDLTRTGAFFKTPTAVIATAVRKGDGTLAGVMVAALEPTRLGELTLTQRRQAGAAYAIFDSQGTLVYHSQLHDLSWEERQYWEDYDPLLHRTLMTGNPQAGVIDLPFRGETWIAARVPISRTGWVAGAGQRATTAFNPIHRNAMADALLLVPVVLAAFLMARLIGLTIVGPLQHLERDTQQMGSSGIVPGNDPGAPEEIRSLRTTMARITGDLVTYTQALQESEERFRLVLENLSEGLMIMTPEGVIIYQNESSMRLHGFEEITVDLARQTAGQQWHVYDRDDRLIPPEEWPYRRVLQGERFDEMVLHIVRMDAPRDFYGRYSGIPVVDQAGKVRLAFFTVRDDTARILAEQELQRSKDELEARVKERTRQLEQTYRQLQEETSERLAAVEELRTSERLLIQQSRLAAMGEMISNISHQWRQPLNVLGLVVQELLLSCQRGHLDMAVLEAGVRRAMAIIAGMSQTIDDFRNFFSSDKASILFSIREVVEKMLSMLDEDFHQLQVRVELTDEVQMPLEGLRNEFSQVILNILTNARDVFRERNTPNPSLKIRIFHEGDLTVVTLGDNAGGIHERFMDKVFDPYFTTKGPDRGTGIGLFMSKTIIEKNMRGRLSARNTSEGAEFRIELQG